MPRNQLIQPRNGTAVTWTSVDPVLAVAEFGIESDTGQFKIGDGITTWNSLPYANGSGAAPSALMAVPLVPSSSNPSGWAMPTTAPSGLTILDYDDFNSNTLSAIWFAEDSSLYGPPGASNHGWQLPEMIDTNQTMASCLTINTTAQNIAGQGNVYVSGGAQQASTGILYGGADVMLLVGGPNCPTPTDWIVSLLDVYPSSGSGLTGWPALELGWYEDQGGYSDTMNVDYSYGPMLTFTSTTSGQYAGSTPNVGDDIVAFAGGITVTGGTPTINSVTPSGTSYGNFTIALNGATVVNGGTHQALSASKLHSYGLPALQGQWNCWSFRWAPGEVYVFVTGPSTGWEPSVIAALFSPNIGAPNLTPGFISITVQQESYGGGGAPTSGQLVFTESCTTNSASTTITIPSSTSVAVNQVVLGANILPGTYVVSVGSTSAVLSQKPTSSTTLTLTFGTLYGQTLADWAVIYTLDSVSAAGSFASGIVAPPVALPPRAEVLSVGEIILPRSSIIQASSLTSGTVQFSYWTAARTETIGHVTTLTGSQAAVTPTWAEVGIYSIDGSGNLTLLATTGNTSGLWNADYTEFTTALGTSFAKMAGVRYAVGILSVAATAPSLAGQYLYFTDKAPVIAASLATQTSLPTTVASSGLTVGGISLAFQTLLTP